MKWGTHLNLVGTLFVGTKALHGIILYTIPSCRDTCRLDKKTPEEPGLQSSSYNMVIKERSYAS